MECREMKMETGTERPSLLGFGCMRFPLTPEGTICEPEAEKLLDQAMQAGVTYIDTAYPYHEGASEPFLGRALKKYPRDSFYLATKLPVWKVETLEEAQAAFAEQLERLQVDYIDFYLLHGLSRERWDKIKRLRLTDWAEDLIKQGKIRHLGFSFHDDYQVFEEILTSRKWDFCQIQYNYMDRDYQAGDKGYELARELGVPVVVMEPVKGGMLAELPADISSLFTHEDPQRSAASWAMRWVAGHPGVKVILSGMSTSEQVMDNLETFRDFKPLTQAEMAVVEQAARAVRSRVKNGCTGCRYCMPCPFGVNIPGNFAAWNEYAMYENQARARGRYWTEMKAEERAVMCRECGQCESACPQGIGIRGDLKAVAREMRELELT